MTPAQKLLAAFETRIAAYTATSINRAASLEGRLVSATLSVVRPAA